MERPEIVELKGRRHYKLGDKLLPSVTTVLSTTRNNEALLKWKQSTGAAQAQAISNQAKSRGTAIHKLCEMALRGEEIGQVSPLLEPYWQSLQSALKRIQHPRFIEEFVWHREYLYGGTIDLLCTYDETAATLIDFKTTAKPGNLALYIQDYVLQCVAYALALRDTHGVEVNQAVLVIANPKQDAVIKTITLDEMPVLITHWLDRLKLFNEVSELAKQPDKPSIEGSCVDVSQAFKW